MGSVGFVIMRCCAYRSRAIDSTNSPPRSSVGEKGASRGSGGRVGRSGGTPGVGCARPANLRWQRERRDLQSQRARRGCRSGGPYQATSLRLRHERWFLSGAERFLSRAGAGSGAPFRSFVRRSFVWSSYLFCGENRGPRGECERLHMVLRMSRTLYSTVSEACSRGFSFQISFSFLFFFFSFF
jgi:hypothetical protein